MSLPKGLYKKTYNGQEIIVSDYRGLSDDEMLTMVEALQDYILTEKPKARLVIGHGGDLPMAVRVFVRKMGSNIKHIPTKVAVLGTPLAKRLLLQSYNRIIGGSMKFYENEKDAIAYLTQ